MLVWKSPVGIAESSGASPPRRLSSSLARPKSRIFACPRSVTNRLAGLMSRWATPLRCAASSASAMWIAYSTTSSLGSGRPVSRLFSVWPSSSSMAMNIRPSASSAS